MIHLEKSEMERVKRGRERERGRNNNNNCKGERATITLSNNARKKWNKKEICKWMVLCCVVLCVACQLTTRWRKAIIQLSFGCAQSFLQDFRCIRIRIRIHTIKYIPLEPCEWLNLIPHRILIRSMCFHLHLHRFQSKADKL